MFINRLAKAPRELVSFTNSIKDKIPISDFIKLDFKYQLGWYINYLDSNNIAVVVNKVSYRVYYAKTNTVKRKSFKDCSMIDIWMEAIVDSFMYLETPF